MAFSSLAFYIKLRILRLITKILAWLDRRRNPALSLTPSSRVAIPATIFTSPSNFEIFFYRPSNYNQEAAESKQYPIVLVFHGGGWCVGDARHDERFIATLTARGAIVAAVNYRLSPEHPYPAPLADSLDAMLYIWKNATTLGIDKDRTYLAGFSVGGQMAIASMFMLRKALQDEDPRVDRTALGTVKGITAFYPMDLTISRAERAASNPDFVALKKKPASSSKFAGSIFDQAYFWKIPKSPEKSHMYLSPGLAPLEEIKAALPEKMFFKLASLDPLLVEGKTAADRFKATGKQVDCETIRDVPHYWDHLAKTEYTKKLRQTVYERAADEIQKVLEIKNI